MRPSVVLGLLLAGLYGGAACQAPVQKPSPDVPLELIFLDVGQADAILIKLGRRAVLVDAGRGNADPLCARGRTDRAQVLI